jgi:hypothetical protein
VSVYEYVDAAEKALFLGGKIDTLSFWGNINFDNNTDQLASHGASQPE